MQSKQVYLYDGTPFLIMPDSNGVMEYPKEQWTDVKPPSGIYTPYYFDGTKWIGNTKEKWEQSQPKQEIAPSKQDEINLELTMKNLKLESHIEDLNKDIANLTIMLMEAKGGQ